MRKLLVVDDENFIRLGIKTMIERHPNNNYDVILCANGIEALEILKEQKIDILITDIKMPKMDGIALINAIKERVDKPEIIILSGFDEFSYATEAIRCGVRDYLLKPVKRNELISCLERIEGHIKEKESNTNTKDISKKNIEQYRVTELKYILLKENIGNDELLSIIDRIDIDLLKGEFYLCIIRRKCMKLDFNIDNFVSEIKDMVRGYKKDAEIEYVTYADNDKSIVLISKGLELFTYIQHEIEKKNIVKFYVSINNRIITAQSIKIAYEDAKETLNYRFLTNNKFIFKCSEAVKSNNLYTFPTESIGKLSNMLGSDRDKEIENLFMEIFNINVIKKYDISYFQQICSELKVVLIDDIQNKYFVGQEIGFNNAEKLRSLSNYDCFSEYYHELKDYILCINEYIKNIKDIYGDKKVMERAIDYIKNNFDKVDISLSVVSNEISMNYSYFSQVFKDYTGENFVNYIKKLRIDKAMELLKNSNYKVYEIASKVGYDDSKQFTKIFRNIAGVSPSEYRQRHIIFY